MALHPIDAIIKTGLRVSKADFRSFLKARARIRLADPAEVADTDLSDQHGGILVASLDADFYLDPTDTTSADDGLTILVDDAGNRFKRRNIDSVFRRLLLATVAGQNVNTAQPWFPDDGGVSLAPSTVYRFRGRLHLSRAAGTNSHTTSVLFSASAALADIVALAKAKEGDDALIADISGVRMTAITAAVVKAASTSATEQAVIEIEGRLVTNAATVLTPQFQYSAAPGGAPDIRSGSFFEIWPISNAEVYGPWA